MDIPDECVPAALFLETEPALLVAKDEPAELVVPLFPRVPLLAAGREAEALDAVLLTAPEDVPPREETLLVTARPSPVLLREP